MRLGAHVLLPKGFDTHPDAKYPLALFHGHFPADFEGFRPEPPEEELEPDLATRFALPIPGVSTANSQQRTLGIRPWWQASCSTALLDVLNSVAACI